MANQSDGPHASLNGPDAVTPVAEAIPAANDTGTEDPAPNQRSQTIISEHAGLLEVFKANLVQAGLYRPAADSEVGGASHDDTTLIRFLRARRFDVHKAERQFTRTEEWRKQHNVDELFKTFDVAELESSRRFYPRWTGRRDKHGVPVYVYRIGSLDSSLRQELDAISPERRYQRVIALYETMTRFVLPLCDHLPHEPPTKISSATAIIDLADVPFTTMWSFRAHLQQASTIANAHYPETLNFIAVVNSPSFFPTVWNWIKGWFDEPTRRKIHILGRDPGSFLRELIDEEDLPVSYGGKLKWAFGDAPLLDNDIHKTIGEMPKGPVTFTDGKIVRP